MPMVAKETNTQFDKSAIQAQKKNWFVLSVLVLSFGSS
jgi:hypothetical protein